MLTKVSLSSRPHSDRFAAPNYAVNFGISPKAINTSIDMMNSTLKPDTTLEKVKLLGSGFVKAITNPDNKTKLVEKVFEEGNKLGNKGKWIDHDPVNRSLYRGSGQTLCDIATEISQLNHYGIGWEFKHICGLASNYAIESLTHMFGFWPK